MMGRFIAVTLLWLLLAPSLALAQLAMDGTPATGQISGAATNSIATGTLTTTVDGDLIVLLVTTSDNAAGGGPFTVSSVAGGSLTWAKRTGQTMVNSVSNHIATEIWWAKQTTHGALTATATLSGNALSGCAIVFGVSGADTTTPFDSNVSLPGVGTNTSNSTGAVVTATISTSNANDMLIGFNSNSAGGTTPPYGLQTGFSRIAQINGFSGAPNFGTMNCDAMQQIVSATQSSLAVGYTTSIVSVLFLADAIKKAGAAPPAVPPLRALMGVGQ